MIIFDRRFGSFNAGLGRPTIDDGARPRIRRKAVMDWRRKGRSWKAHAAVLGVSGSLFGCDDPVPLGPDLVECQCECVTRRPLSPGQPPGGCGSGDFCDPPCPESQFCKALGGCVPACPPEEPPPVFET